MGECVTSSNSSNSFQASVNYSGVNVSNNEGRVLESNDGGDLNEHKVSVNVCSLVILLGLIKVAEECVGSPQAEGNQTEIR